VLDRLFNPFGHTADFLKYNYLIDHVVTEDNAMKAWLKLRGESEGVISVIPNGIDLEQLRPRPKESWRAKKGLSAPASHARPFVVGVFGPLSEEKATGTFIGIAAQFRERQDVEFIVAGGGPLEEELRHRVVLQALKNVHFLGVVASEDYLACCDVLVACSRVDDRPNIFMESQAMGIPVIASRVRTLPEMIDLDHTGLLVNVEDVNSFARAIEDLLNNPERHRQMSRSARQWAEAHFSIAGSVEKYAKLFEQLACKQKLASAGVPSVMGAT
jgi:glycosyltransferase involved in cell wall biosynthesis